MVNGNSRGRGVSGFYGPMSGGSNYYGGLKYVKSKAMETVVGANTQGSVPEADIEVIEGKGKAQLEDGDQQASPQPMEEYDLLHHCE
jgi:hypothetical protein